ncbi:hypothetical protein [Chryseobacterium geocarposphaerae]|uniref:YD repeat-containing protein n=1 Tax=Chryseobacterium geocarposphaerae TaxID=1416776 RepID=A0A2M9C1I3_9FLAO|nr:hypothetical protein [Chryseobacterium geocarposphaerae]PJJ64277.1 hypothetical protein CLV73_2635 [Chryseobacterium geocarposphaerae]
MKRLFYFILLVAGISSIHSCKDLADENGDPLVDINTNTGLNGARALHQEITDFATVADYHYTGLLLTKVNNGASITDIAYSGDRISKITFDGFLDLDNNGTLDPGKVTYTQLFTYGASGRLESITENRNIYKLTGTPPAQVLDKQTKSVYTLKYNASTAKLETITMKTGLEVSGTPFEYTAYSEAKYTYLGDNISKVEKGFGTITAGVNDPITVKYEFGFLNYDDRISPYTLLPTAYKISYILSTSLNDSRCLMLSPNNPSRVSFTDLNVPVPAPVVTSTNFTYDQQTYLTKGYGRYYIYKPL